MKKPQNPRSEWLWSKRLSQAAGIGLAIAALTSAIPASAQDASFGCKVLLCASASNPSWSGIPYCVPPMTQLFSDLAKGKPWPDCPEAGETGDLGYEPYYPCPNGGIAGQVVTDPTSHAMSFRPSANGSQCLKLTGPVRLQTQSNGDGYSLTNQSTSWENVTTVRDARPEPNFVVIRQSGNQPFTFWFKLLPQ